MRIKTKVVFAEEPLISCRLMQALAGPAIALLALLTLAGVMKISDPAATSGALRAAGLPASYWAVRLLGMIEVGAGIVAFSTGGGVALAVAAAFYAGFAWFVLNAIHKHLPISSCGCLGAAETPPSLTHVAVNLAAFVVLLVAAVVPVAPWEVLASMPAAELAPFVVFTGVTVYLLYGVIAVLPRRQAGRLTTDRRRMPETPITS